MRPLPTFQDGLKYLLSGRKLNEIMAAIRERTPLAGPGLTHKDTPDGRTLRLDAQSAEQGDWAFRCRWLTAGTIRVSSGAVFSPTWPGTVDPEDPAPVGWVNRTSVASADKTISDGQSIYFSIALDLTPYTSRGPFPEQLEGLGPWPDFPQTQMIAANLWRLDSVTLVVDGTGTPPASSSTLLHLPLCEVSGGTIKHRHLGDLNLWLPIHPFIFPTYPFP